MENINLNDRVKVLGKNTTGKVAFVGETHFADGTWFGIVLDEPKGRNNGTVDGKRFFNCPPNYGIFVRSCQIRKETIDGPESGDNTNSFSRKFPYPNYLKSSSKLKIDKHSCEVKSRYPVRKFKPRLKIIESKIVEEDHESLMKEKDEELKNFQEQNSNLKIKLENTLQNYEKAKEEINNLKTELDLKKEQINVQKSHLELLKMRLSIYYKDLTFFRTPDKGNNKSSSGKQAKDDSNLMKGLDGINLSEDEFDLESLKSLTSMQRVVELEEQNRVMFQGLIALRQFLKKNCSRVATNLNIANDEIQQRQLGQKDNPSSFSESNVFNFLGKRNEISGDELTQNKKYGDMLREMTQFKKVMKANGKNFCNDDEMLQLQNELMRKYCSDVDANTNLVIPDLQKDPEKSPKTSNCNNKNFQQFYSAAQNQHFQQLVKQLSKIMSNASNFGNMSFENDETSPEFTNTMIELKQFISAIAPCVGDNDVKQSPSATPNEQQDLQFKKSSNTISVPVQSINRPGSLSSSDYVIDSTVQSGGDSACVKPTGGKGLKRKVL